MNVSSKSGLFLATQLAVVIDDVALALAIVVQFSVARVTVTSLAARLQVITIHVNVHAALSIRAVRSIRSHIPTWGVVRAGTVSSNRGSGYAAELSVIVRDISSALIEVVQLGIVPATVLRLTTRVQIIAANANIGARLRVRTRRTVYVAVDSRTAVRSAGIDSRPGSVRALAVSSYGRAGYAAKVSIIVDYVTGALVVVVQLGVTPVSVLRPAAGMQVIAFGVNVLAALQIRA